MAGHRLQITHYRPKGEMVAHDCVSGDGFLVSAGFWVKGRWWLMLGGCLMLGWLRGWAELAKIFKFED